MSPKRTADRDPRETREAIARVEDPFARRATSAAYHVRRYAPFYVVAVVWLVSLMVFPTVTRSADTSNVFTEGTGGDVGQVDSPADFAGGTDVTGAPLEGGTAADTGATGAGPTGAAAAGPTGSGGRTAGGARTPAARAEAAFVPQTGKTRGGVDCEPGVRQVPISTYATSCRPKFEGANAGATFRGVTKDKIRVVRRYFADTSNSQAVDAVNERAGFASSDVVKQVQMVFIGYFNKMYELYGRQVEWVEYESRNGESTQEAQSKGREGACADATQVVSELQAFAVALTGGSSPFSECAAERKLMVTNAAAYFPDQFYRQRSPYLWHTLMDCERIAYQVAEYTAKRLAGKNAQWAGSPALREQKRKFGIYVPDNDGYQRCVNIAVSQLMQRYGQPRPAQYNYQLDISRFPDQAAQAIVQFKAAGVTTINNSCDYISTIFLTEAAANQNYFPEWQIIGVAAQDTDNAARLFDQEAVNGHLFGMSQLGATSKLLGPKSEAGRLYKLITGKDIPAGTTGRYYELTHLFNLLQAGGPNLTPQSIAANAKNIPDGGMPDLSYGYWSLKDGSDGTKGAGDFTEVDDSREVFWVSEPGTNTAPATKPKDPYYAGDGGNNGAWKETYGGRRFRNGEWPAEDPPIYPKR